MSTAWLTSQDADINVNELTEEMLTNISESGYDSHSCTSSLTSAVHNSGNPLNVLAQFATTDLERREKDDREKQFLELQQVLQQQQNQTKMLQDEINRLRSEKSANPVNHNGKTSMASNHARTYTLPLHAGVTQTPMLIDSSKTDGPQLIYQELMPKHPPHHCVSPPRACFVCVSAIPDNTRSLQTCSVSKIQTPSNACFPRWTRGSSTPSGPLPPAA